MGSITIDLLLMKEANIITGDHVHILNVNNGERFSTYVIAGAPGAGEIILNRPDARKVQKDDIVIIISYVIMDFQEAKKFKPWIIFPDQKTNRCKTESCQVL